MMLAVPMAASAQESIDTVKKAGPTLAGEYEAMTSRLRITFWTPRLHAYREEIDRMLSASDRLEVDELRARAALLLEQRNRFQMKQRGESWVTVESSYEEYAVDTMASAGSDGEQFEPRAEMVPSTEATVTVAEYAQIDTATSGETGYYGTMENERSEESYRNDLQLLERLLAGDENALGTSDNTTGGHELSGFPVNDDMMLHIDKTRIMSVAGWIGRNYRTGLDEIGAHYLADFDRYLVALRDSTRQFYAVHRAEIARNADGSGWRTAGAMIDNLLRRNELAEENGKRYFADYRVGMKDIEAALMIFHGQSLNEFMMLHPLSSQGEPYDETAAPITLGKNSPDPASVRTVIPYTLAEPGTDVLLQVLDMRGVLIATFNQGARDAGTHSASIDLATLPAGDYLYQLRIRTATGERIHTRVMTVGK
jgi:hypothetical protein